ncbi:MAG: biotin--[acetyl-CoA-carboxylase] ligase [Brevinematales bacterium]|nr:biotin--[acetyl-CoA-carboxylase] ligase [Brevinematales bacterium]
MRQNLKDRVVELLLSGDVVSGNVISTKLGISRVMVNRYIKKLVNEGFDIQIMKHLGYKLNSYPDVIYPSIIKSKLGSSFSIVVFDELDSTNTYALRNADSIQDKTVIISDHQTKGRGRFDREWFSEKCKDVTMSIVFKPNIPVEKIIKYTISSSLAVLDALKDFDIGNAFIKWPNDIMYEDKKLCGILTESTIEYTTGLVEVLVIGIGLNVNSNPSRYIPNAISIYEILGFEVRRTSIISKILYNLDANIKLSYEELYMRWRENMGYIGKKVILKYEGTEISCRFVDVSRSGEIIVEDNNTIRKFSFGEVSLIPD